MCHYQPVQQLVWFVACLPCLHEYFKCQLIGWYYSGDGQGGKLLMLNLLAKLQKVGNHYIVGNFQGRKLSQIGEKYDFTEKTFTDCSLKPC